ncbi:unnamed protein product [Wuchereria bancrofti]|uniref:Thioredoxin domain-containing protein n=1 Tax=Wuchereria bancrofti TaxID=6293 RepID=A0A3P7DRP5_WUCBA|nr:unnamed protein product [Wuchereria bancrofti]
MLDQKTPLQNSEMADLFANIDLKKADGTVKKGSDALANKKVVALYFSAHWCPKCRQFTPVLKTFLEKYRDGISHKQEIVLVVDERNAPACVKIGEDKRN